MQRSGGSRLRNTRQIGLLDLFPRPVNLSSPRSFPFPVGFRTVLAAGALTLSPASGMEIQGYSQLTHDWLLNNPALPDFNDSFSPSANLFSAIGAPDDEVEWFRHMALISPKHFVYATHYPIPQGIAIRFLGADGVYQIRVVSETAPVLNPTGQATDLMLGTLSQPVDVAAGVEPFQVLNLPTENDYLGLELLIFGKAARVGSMEIDGFATLVNDPGFDTTRFAYFDYDPAHAAPGDCRYEGGDSGCPVVIMQADVPTLVGTNSGLNPLGGQQVRNYCNFIPSYLDPLDAMMEADGYHVRRFFSEATTLGSTVSSTVELRRSVPGSITITTQNLGLAEAHNFVASLTFTSPPTEISGSGWICDEMAPAVWSCRFAGLQGGTNSHLTASWDQLPDEASVGITGDLEFDGGDSISINQSLELIESYVSWSAGIAEAAPMDDGDQDGLVNLLEYAFGGDPTIPSRRSPDEWLLGLSATRMGSDLLVTFPRRTDSDARGLDYVVEFQNPSGEWVEEFPANVTPVTATDFSPTVAGFEQAKLRIPMSDARRLVRVRISLIEE